MSNLLVDPDVKMLFIGCIRTDATTPNINTTNTNTNTNSNSNSSSSSWSTGLDNLMKSTTTTTAKDSNPSDEILKKLSLIDRNGNDFLSFLSLPPFLQDDIISISNMLSSAIRSFFLF